MMSKVSGASNLSGSLFAAASDMKTGWLFFMGQPATSRSSETIRDVAWNQAQVTEASILIILCANLHSYENGARYWVNAPESVQKILVPMIEPFYKDKPELQRDEAMRSVGIAAQTLMLAAKSMGYGSCPMIGFDPVKVAEIIRLPEHHVIGMMLPVGKAIEEAHPRGGQLAYDEVVIRDSF